MAPREVTLALESDVPGLDPVRCYRALRSRDRRFDGRFFVGVTTTGIYCRPICPARPARADHVIFFPSAAAAEGAGFRACLRCHPEASPGTPGWLGTSASVSRALRLIGEGYLDHHPLEDFARQLGMGPRHLRRLFAEHVGASPLRVARTRRAHFARKLIGETNLSMTEIAFAAGFSSVRRFNGAIKERFGRSPRELRASRPRPLRNEGRLALRLSFRPPYDWPAIRDFLRARAIPGVERVEADRYSRTVRVGDGSGTLEVSPRIEEQCLVLEVDALPPGQLFGTVERVRRLFDLGADPLAVDSHLARDPRIGASVRRRAGLRLPGAWCTFELAVRAILGQQVSVAAARGVAGRISRELGEELHESVRRSHLTHLFPTPAVLAGASDAVLRIPRQRAGAIRGLARAVAEGEPVLDASLGLEDAIDRLTRLPGIGPWTAQYIAMRALGEPDAFPAGDLGLRRAFSPAISEVELTRRAEAWRPWRAYAAMHLWLGTPASTKGKVS